MTNQTKQGMRNSANQDNTGYLPVEDAEFIRMAKEVQRASTRGFKKDSVQMVLVEGIGIAPRINDCSDPQPGKQRMRNSANQDNTGYLPVEDAEFIRMVNEVQRAPIREYKKDSMQMVLFEGRGPSINDWSDLQPGKKKTYRLYRLSDDTAVMELGEKVFNSLCSAVTKQALCCVMLLAYNLKDSNGQYVFDTTTSRLIKRREIMDFSEIADVVRAYETAPRRWSYSRKNPTIAQKATSFCYFACSFMRLYTVSVDNYDQIANHITGMFTHFYDFPLAIKNFAPSARVVTAIKSQFTVNSILKNTFYVFLYAGQSVGYGKPLKEFLYGTNTAFSGLHAYNLFLRCMEGMNVSNIELASALDCALFKRQLKALTDLFKNFFTDDPDKKRQMWKYARIFEPRFLHDLQTKNSLIFTYALAYLCKKVNPSAGNQNPLRIVKFENTTNYQRTMGALVALRVHSLLTKDKDVSSRKRKRARRAE